MKIEKAIYQGYVWFSDCAEPTVIESEYGIDIEDDVNPFIVEGQLYDPETKISYSIRYADGKHVWKKYVLAELKGESREQTYCSNKMQGRKLKFREYWKAVPDPLCEGMEVLQMAENVFIGFEK